MLMGTRFDYICDIVPDLLDDGTPREFMPQAEYSNPRHLCLHKYGAGPFCRFRIPVDKARAAGVYVVCVDDMVKYIGECEDLVKRFNQGYGTISPRNCFQGGRQTNCRINMLILGRHKSGSKIRLYFHETRDRFALEERLIRGVRPRWNIG
jgi:hypothetical protein